MTRCTGRRTGRRTERAERGAATIYAVMLIAVLTVSALALTVLASVFALRRQMESAADLTALAAAQAHQRGRDPCAAAAEIAVRNSAELTSCAVVGDDVRVTVSRRGDGLLGGVAVPARARAGPAS